MIRIYGAEYLSKNTEEGKGIYDMVLYADTAAELAEVTEINGKVISAGSTAITGDGKGLIFTSENEWHDVSDGTAVTGA